MTRVHSMAMQLSSDLCARNLAQDSDLIGHILQNAYYASIPFNEVVSLIIQSMFFRKRFDQCCTLSKIVSW